MSLLIMRVSVLLLLSFPSVISEVIGFSNCSDFFLNERPPVISDILNNSVSMDNRYKTICQKYNGKYRFATLYNTTGRIPVFSAYRFTANILITRPDVEWMVEPQLELSGSQTDSEMRVTCANQATDEDYFSNTDKRIPVFSSDGSTSEIHIKRPKIKWMIEPQLELSKSQADSEMRVPYANQATDEDYFNNTDQVNRGHLFPSCHAADEVTANSTFTLTNIVPQKISFNSGSWNRMERKTEEKMIKYCRDQNDQSKVLAHVLTGAVPGNMTMKERVNIPSYMWMTFCCYNGTNGSWSSQAYWAPNKEENKNDSVPISEKSLQELQQLLSENLMTDIQLFDNSTCTTM